MILLIIFLAEYLIYAISLFVAIYVYFINGNTKKFYKNIFLVILTTILAWAVADFLKDMIKHMRPDETLALLKESTYSFPSGHTAYISALGFSILNINKRVSYLVICLSLVVGFARVIAGVHFWYDILGGFVLGILIAFVFSKIIKKYI